MAIEGLRMTPYPDAFLASNRLRLCGCDMLAGFVITPLADSVSWRENAVIHCAGLAN